MPIHFFSPYAYHKQFAALPQSKSTYGLFLLLLFQIHKYIIQAQVLRDSWPLSKSAWDFVALIKSLDRLDVEGISAFLGFKPFCLRV